MDAGRQLLKSAEAANLGSAKNCVDYGATAPPEKKETAKKARRASMALEATVVNDEEEA